MRQRLPRGRTGWPRTRAWSASISPATRAHPDAATIRRLFPPNLYGGMVSFEIRGAGREEVFRFMDAPAS